MGIKIADNVWAGHRSVNKQKRTCNRLQNEATGTEKTKDNPDNRQAIGQQ
jgi:hypothetical protein